MTSPGGGWPKRLLDLSLSVPALVLVLPLTVVAWALARYETGEPGFFSQERIGLGGRPFRIFKIRTMRTVAAGSLTTKENDDRVTRSGRWMRRFKIDEVPQLLNVLTGTMSLVGPRPTVYEDYARMDATQRRRFLVPPGLTGLAQISGNTSLTWPERIELDLAYVERASLWFDLVIIARTAAMVVTGRLETHPPSDDEWGAT
jgi:lipopolysaccharide/colanic/teichoic acid biosynthesis glycosyltransferase